MLGAIFIGLSGMNAYSKGLQTIGNNVANLNSAGFKATWTNFTDAFSFGGDGMSGSGVRYAQPRIDFQQGELRQTTGDLDLAIQGNGFLALLDGDKGSFARTGQFFVDEEGFITLQGTEYHLCVLDESRQPVELNIGSKRTSEPVETTRITFADHLTGTATSVSNIAVYDTAGGKRVWKVDFAPVAATPGEWQVTITNENGDTVATSTLKFNGSVVDPTTSNLTVIDSTGTGAPLSVVLDFTDVKSFSGGTNVGIRAKSVDGNGLGTLTGATIDADGQVKLTYSNGKTELVGSVALAEFRDPQMLDHAGNGLFENRAGAEYRMVSSGTDGMGKLVSRQIEASNVDLSQQFGDLILIQRGFQASSQVVSVSNDMIQQLFGIRGQG